MTGNYKKPCKVCGKDACHNAKTGLCVTCSREERKRQYLYKWLQTGIITREQPGKWVHEYVLDEQDHKCVICGMNDTWNGQLLVFVLDHIDGNSTNHQRKNLRMVCPNCDSQLPTYKSKNKGNGRPYRVNYYKRRSDRVAEGAGFEPQ